MRLNRQSEQKVGFDLWLADDHKICGTAANKMHKALKISMDGARLARQLKSIFLPVLLRGPIPSTTLLAQTFATLRQMYPGRVGIAVGAGEAMNEVLVTRVNGLQKEYSKTKHDQKPLM